MKILLCIIHGKIEDTKIYLHKLIKSYKETGYKVDIVIHTTFEFSFEEFDDIEIIKLDPKIGKKIGFEHRKVMAERINEYDLFIYSENDLIIRKENIDEYLELVNFLPDDYITGFFRYEKKQSSDEFYLVDNYPGFHSVIKGGPVKIKDKWFFRPVNLHAGIYALTQKQLKKCIDSGGFLVKPHIIKFGKHKYNPIETAATDVYTQCGFKWKVYPADESLDNLLVYHSTNKVTKGGGFWTDPGPYTKKQLIAKVHNLSPFEKFKSNLVHNTSLWKTKSNPI